MGDTWVVRNRLFAVAVVFAIGFAASTFLTVAAVFAPASPAHAQADARPTAEQPDAGLPFSDTPRQHPWYQNHMAKYVFWVISPLLLAALLVGFVLRVIGVGRGRTV